jgi:hypothetical protein
MATFSFSHTGNYWKTRYSFEPSHYTHIDNALLSYTQNEEQEMTTEVAVVQETIWKHNSNSSDVPLNNFYGYQNGSFILLSSNQDPSAEKVFRAVSLESNQNVFTGLVFTNVDLQGFSVTRGQQSSLLGDFIPKEENLYSDIKPSIFNSTTNLVPIGLVKARTTNSVTIYGQVNNVPTGAIPVFVTTSPDGVTTLRATITLSNGSSVGVDTSVIESIPGFLNSVAADGASTIGEAGLYENQTIIDIDGAGILAMNYVVPDQTRLMALLDPSIHGDAMRGKYLLVSLSTKPGMGDRPFELYAVNVEYSHSNLDSRLGQNS